MRAPWSTTRSRKRRGAKAALLTAVALSVLPPAHAADAGVTESGWWSRSELSALPLPSQFEPATPPVPTAPDGGLYVARGASGPTGMSALKVAGAGKGPMTLRLSLAPGAINPSGAEVAACPVTSAWEVAAGGHWERRPTVDCDRGQVVGQVENAGQALRWDVPASEDYELDGALHIALVPAPGRTTPFAIAFEAPATDAVSTSGTAPGPAIEPDAAPTLETPDDPGTAAVPPLPPMPPALDRPAAPSGPGASPDAAMPGAQIDGATGVVPASRSAKSATINLFAAVLAVLGAVVWEYSGRKPAPALVIGARRSATRVAPTAGTPAELRAASAGPNRTSPVQPAASTAAVPSAAGESRSALLEAHQVDFSYGPLQVLFGLDLHVVQGEILGLLGTNGAGKSTVLRVLTGLAVPDAGRIVLDGQDVTGSSADRMAARGVVQVPGGKAIFPDLTVQENLLVGGHLVPARERSTRIEEQLDLFPRLRDRSRAMAASLSGGEQQQLAIAKALLLKPRVLCIDELSLGLAPRIVEGLLETLRGVHAAGTTIVVVEQSLNIAIALCDRAVFLEKGQVRFDGRPEELLRRGDLARAVFLGGGPTRSDAAGMS